MRWMLILLVPLVLIFLCAIAMLAIPLPRPLPEPFSRGRNLVAAIGTGGLGLLYVGGLAVYLVTGVLGSGRSLDPAFAAAGFTSQSYMLTGREYRGMVRGRPAVVRYIPPYRAQAAVVDMTIRGSSPVRWAAGAQRPLLDCRDCAPMTVDAPALAGLQVYAADEAAVRPLLADVEVQAVLSRLLIETRAWGATELYVQPEQVWLRAHLRPAPDDRLLAWLDDLARLAE